MPYDVLHTQTHISAYQFKTYFSDLLLFKKGILLPMQNLQQRRHRCYYSFKFCRYRTRFSALWNAVFCLCMPHIHCLHISAGTMSGLTRLVTRGLRATELRYLFKLLTQERGKSYHNINVGICISRNE